LLFSAPTAQDVYAQGLISYLQARHRRFRFMPTLTRKHHEGMLHGRIPDILHQQFPDLSGHSVFIAGSPEFVENCKQAAMALGARPELIHTEAYYPRAVAQSPKESQLVHALAAACMSITSRPSRSISWRSFSCCGLAVVNSSSP